MAFKITVMPSALADLDDQTQYIAKHSVQNSRRWLSGAWDVIMSLQEFPLRSPVIPESEELGQELRCVHHHSHRIVYLVEESREEVFVLRVWHGARQAITSEELDPS